MTEMIERVARAIHSAEVEDEGDPWNDLGDYVQGEYRTLARAAIAAMREPTEAMLGPPWNYGRLEIWQAMIDEALK